jgi:hypothetical protein
VETADYHREVAVTAPQLRITNYEFLAGAARRGDNPTASALAAQRFGINRLKFGALKRR